MRPDGSPLVVQLPGRTVEVRLASVGSNPDGASLSATTVATVTVLDDDAVGSLEFAAPTHRHEAGQASSLAVIRRGGVAGRLVARVVFTADGQTLPTAELEFPAGVSQRIVPLPELIATDGTEPELTLALSLAGGSAEGGTVGNPAEARVDYVPTRPAVRILRLESAAGGQVRITAVGPAGRKHRLESSTDLSGWQPLPGTAELTTQGETPVTLDVPAEVPARFLRLRPLSEF